MTVNRQLEIRTKENFRNGIIRLLEQLNKDTARLMVARSRVHLSVHEARKNVKKIRAVLRLVRYEIGNDQYRELNTFYQGIGQQVAILRDETSLIELLENFRLRVNSGAMEKVIRKSIKQTVKKRKKEFDDFYKKKNHQMIHDQLSERFNGIRKLEITGDPNLFIIKSIGKIYSDCLTAMNKTKKDTSDATYHNWRKQVKYLMYNMMILKNAWPSFFETYIAELDELQKALGNLHDLNLFNGLVVEADLFSLDKKQKDLMLRFIYPRRKALKLQIHQISDRLFSEDKTSFSKRIYGIWQNSIYSTKKV